MPVLIVIALLIVPVSIGALIMTVLRNREADILTLYVSGLLFLFLWIEAVVLATLKFDFDFAKTTNLLTYSIIALTAVSLPFLVIKLRKYHNPLVFNRNLLYIGLPAVGMIVLFFVFMEPYEMNDCTYETVNSILTSGNLYTVNVFTGQAVTNGFAIFNKTPILPVLYAYVCQISGLKVDLVVGLLFPILFFSISTLIAYRISHSLFGENSKDARMFMWLYDLLLVCGTYLPLGQLPSTAGFAILRQGFTGYAVSFGIIIPFSILMFQRKKYYLGVFTLLPIAVLIRLDRLFFSLLDGMNTFEQLKRSGKIIGLYVIALLVFIYHYLKSNQKFRISTVLSSILLIPYAITTLLRQEKSQRKRVLFSLVSVLLFLFAANFRPAENAAWRIGNQQNEVIKQVIAEANTHTTTVVWSDTSVMNSIRKATGKIMLPYGRDIDAPKLTGFSYELYNDNTLLLYRFMRHLEHPYYYEAPDVSLQEIVSAINKENINLIVMKSEMIPQEFADILEENGYLTQTKDNGYLFLMKQ